MSTDLTYLQATNKKAIQVMQNATQVCNEFRGTLQASLMPETICLNKGTYHENNRELLAGQNTQSRDQSQIGTAGVP